MNRTNKIKLPSILSTQDSSVLAYCLMAIGLGAVGGIAAVALPNPLIGFAAVAGLLVAYFMFGRPLFTLMIASVISCLLPFAVIPVKFGLTLTLLEASLIILFVVWLLKLASRATEADRKLVSSPFDWAVLLFVGMCLFAFILGLGNIDSTDKIHNFFKLMLAILSFFAVINIVRTQTALNNILKLLLVAGSLSGWIGLGLYVLPRGLQERLLLTLQPIGYPTNRVLRYVEDDPLKPQRATGTLVDPNSYGGLLVLAIAIIFLQMFSPKPIFRRWVLVLMLVGPTLSLYLTYGRGAQVGALVVLAFVATVKYRRLWLYALPAIGLGLVILPNTFLWDRLMQGFRLEDPASIMRLNEYANALAILERYPWFGVGFGNSPSVDLVVGVSMIYLTITTNMGLVGLAAFLLVMTLFFLYVLKNIGKVKDGRQQANLLGFAGGIIGALAVGVADHYFFNIEYSHMAALFWLYIGLAVAQIKISQQESESSGQWSVVRI